MFGFVIQQPLKFLVRLLLVGCDPRSLLLLQDVHFLVDVVGGDRRDFFRRQGAYSLREDQRFVEVVNGQRRFVKLVQLPVVRVDDARA